MSVAEQDLTRHSTELHAADHFGLLLQSKVDEPWLLASPSRFPSLSHEQEFRKPGQLCLQWNCEVITKQRKYFQFKNCSNSKTSDVWEEDSSSQKVPKINNPCSFKWHKNILAFLFTDELLTCSAGGWSSSHASRWTKIHKMFLRLLQILCIPKILTLIYTSFHLSPLFSREVTKIWQQSWIYVWIASWKTWQLF